MWLIQAQVDHPCNVESFPEGCDRSVRGSLHLHPGGTLEVTAGELAHLRAVGIQLRVLRAPVDPPQALPLRADPIDRPDGRPVSAPTARRKKDPAKA